MVFLGGTIGNLLPEARSTFLRDIAAMLGPDDYFLLGTDLVKDVDRLEAAYDDARGVTAEFNKNVLHVMNRELGADFDVDAFEHVAVFDTDREWIEMRLRSTREQTVHVRRARSRRAVRRGRGDAHRGERQVHAATRRTRVAAAGMELVEFWTDDARRLRPLARWPED